MNKFCDEEVFFFLLKLKVTSLYFQTNKFWCRYKLNKAHSSWHMYSALFNVPTFSCYRYRPAVAFLKP